MITPAPRLILSAGLLVLPLATIMGVVPAARMPLIALILVWAAASAADAILGLRRLEAIGARLPETLRLTKDVAAAFPINFENSSPREVVLRIGIVMPAGVSAQWMTETLVVQPGKSAVAWKVTGVERGDHRLGEVHVEMASPARLWLVRTSVRASMVFRVYPNLRDRATAALLLRTRHEGVRIERQVGKGREFERLREYIPGDIYEDIHWKATARRSFPVVKLYQVEHAQEVYAVVDASRLSAREDMLEGYVGAALHLALTAERQGDRFGLITFGDRPLTFVRARNGMDHFRRCREAIYNLHPQRVSPDFRELFTSIQLNLKRRSLLVFFTSLDDPLLAETFERDVALIARRHVVLVNVMQTGALQPLFAGAPPHDLDAVYGGLAGQMQWNRIRELQIALHNRGVRLAVVNPAEIKMAVASAYLAIKQRQIL